MPQIKESTIDRRVVANLLKSLAGRISSHNKLVSVECNGCGYFDDLTPSEAKRVKNTNRGYYCYRCCSFMQRHNKNSKYYVER